MSTCRRRSRRICPRCLIIQFAIFVLRRSAILHANAGRHQLCLQSSDCPAKGSFEGGFGGAGNGSSSGIGNGSSGGAGSGSGLGGVLGSPIFSPFAVRGAQGKPLTKHSRLIAVYTMFDRTCECPGDLIFPSTSGFADPSCRPPDNVDRIKLGGAVRGQIASNCGGRKLGLGLAGFKTTSDYRAETFAHLNLDPVPLGIGDLVHAHVEIDCAHDAVSAFFLNDSHRWNCSGVCNYDDRAGCDSG